VKIWNIKATGATTAFEVSGYKEAPLQSFSLDNLDIQASKGGQLYDVKDWVFTRAKLALSSPIELEDSSAVRGLPKGSIIVRPAPPKEDTTKKSFEEQDKT
jgi:hypothetical protein